MKLLLISFLLFSSMLARAGVSVGNPLPPLKTYWSSQGGFGVSYPAKLSLSVTDATKFEISNVSLLQSAEPVSKITFQLMKDIAKTSDELAAYVQKNYPSRAFTPIALPGAGGFASEIRTNDHLDGLYFLLTSNKDLVAVAVDAYSAGDGLSWVAPIVNSFTYDVTSPRFQSTHADSTIWKAGTKHKLYFHATDDNSGVGTFDPYASFTREKTATDIWMASEGPIKNEGQDWYSLTFAVSKFQTPGVYCVDGLQITDRAGNFAQLKPDPAHPEKFFYVGDDADDTSTDIPITCVTVENSGASDSTPPMLREIRADEASWTSDRSYNLHLRITDDVSGVDVSTLDCWAQTSDYTCSDPQAEGGDWYTLKITPNRYAPDHEFTFGGIWVDDKAGNEVVFNSDDRQPAHYDYFQPVRTRGDQATTVPVFQLAVKNTTGVDITPPTISDLQFPATVKAGDLMRVRLRAHDAGSGVALKPVTEDQVWGMLLPVSRVGSELIFLLNTFVAEGDDWYHVDVRVNPFAAAGEYFLYSFMVEDNARNINTLECSDGPPQPLPLPFCRGKDGVQIPSVRVQVVR